MIKILKLSLLTFLLPLSMNGQFDLSISTGSMWLDGDVDNLSKIGDVNSVGVRVDYQLFDYIYLDGGINYARIKGLEKSHVWIHFSEGGGLIEPIYLDYAGIHYIPYHITNLVSINGGISLKKYSYHDILFVTIGVLGGLSHSDVRMNLYDENENTYSLPFPSNILGSPGQMVDESLFDNTFESQVEDLGLIAQIGVEVGIGLKVSQNGYVGLRWSMQTTNEDYLDGIKYRTAVDMTNNNEMLIQATVFYTHRFGTFNW